MEHLRLYCRYISNYSSCSLHAVETKKYLFFRGVEFRQDYAKLAELWSIVPHDTTFVAMTATATKAMRADIITKLNMVSSETTTISVLPERNNITYVTKKSKKNLQ